MSLYPWTPKLCREQREAEMLFSENTIMFKNQTMLGKGYIETLYYFRNFYVVLKIISEWKVQENNKNLTKKSIHLRKADSAR